MFSQGVAVLFESCPSLRELEAALEGFAIVKRTESGSSWAFGGPGLVLNYRPEVNGLISVDIVERPWPDSMGDPQEDVEVFGAWSMGFFGPFTYPGNLERAAKQAWHWKEAASAAKRHRAFVRIRSSYTFGANEDAPVLPPDYAPLPELLEVTRVARALLTIPGALAFFDPNGECLCPRSDIDELLARHRSGGPFPQELWINVRLINLGDAPPWIVMDTIGMSQLDVPDHEACCDGKAYDLSAVANFVRNTAAYVFENGEVIRDGDTMDGPGGVRWQGASFESGLLDPPRRVIRWFPLDGRERPALS